jgi:hypothetical protein
MESSTQYETRTQPNIEISATLLNSRPGKETKQTKSILYDDYDECIMRPLEEVRARVQHRGALGIATNGVG